MYVAAGGSDANSGLTPALAKLTLLSAQAAAVAGDDVSVGSQTYLSTDGPSGATNFTFTKVVDYYATTALGAILNSTVSGAASNLATINIDSALDVVFYGIDFNARDIQERMLNRTNTVSDPILTFLKCRFRDSTQYGILDTGTTTAAWRLLQCEMSNVVTGVSGYLVYIPGSTALDFQVVGGNYTISDDGAVTINTIAFYLNAIATFVSANVSITGAIISATANNTANSTAYGIFSKGLPGARFSYNQITVTENSGVGVTYGILLIGASGLDENNAVAEGNKIFLNGRAGNAISAGQGATSDPSWGFVENATIRRNIVIGNSGNTNSPHGVAFNGQATGNGYQNKVTQLCPCFLIQRCSGVKQYSSIGEDSYDVSGVLLCKGATGGGFYNITMKMSKPGAGGGNPTAIRIKAGDDAVNTSNFNVKNCIIYATTTISKMVTVDAGQGAGVTFSNNIYYSTVQLPTDLLFSYQGTAMDFATWKSTVEPTAQWIDPQMVDPVNGDYHLKKYSPAIGAGVTISGVDFDYDNKPFATARPIGAFEYAGN